MKNIFKVTELSEKIIAEYHACPFTDEELVKEALCEVDRLQDFVANDVNYSWFWAIGRVLQPRTIGEIGVRLGYSLLSMSKGMEHLPEIHGWDNESYIAGSLQLTERSLRASGLDQMTFQHTDTQMLASLEKESYFDLFSVDADHTEAGALHDLRLALPAVKSGGYILFDDVTYVRTVYNAAYRFLEEEGLEYHFIPTLRGALLIEKP